jgi:hypothetical protein
LRRTNQLITCQLEVELELVKKNMELLPMIESITASMLAQSMWLMVPEALSPVLWTRVNPSRLVIWSDTPLMKKRKAQGKSKPQAFFIAHAIVLLMLMNVLLSLGALAVIPSY